MQEYSKKSISEVVENINDNFFLPDIQRNFVWKPHQIYSLFDSLLRNYPISTFLFWKLKGNYIKEKEIKKLKFVYRSDETNSIDTSINSEKDYFLILDGQQRLTSFHLVLKGNYIIRNNNYDLYFNILSGEDEIDEILYEFQFFNTKVGSQWAQYDNDKSIENATIEKIWFRVKDIYDIQDLEDVPDLLKENFEDEYKIKLTKNQKKAVSRLLRILKYEKVIHYYPECEEDYDRVLDIFVRTNAGGTKLSYSDLLFSVIKSKWPEAREQFIELVENLNDNDRYNFSNDFILKTILFINATDQDELKYRTKNFGNHIIDKLKNVDYWKKIINTIYLSRDILKDRFYLTHKKLISSHNALIPIIFWIFKNNFKAIGNENHCVNEDNIKKLKVWFNKALLSGVFAGSSDTILYKCKTVLNTSDINFPASEIEEKIKKESKKSMDIDIDDLNKIIYNGRNSNLVLSVVYKNSINFQPSSIHNIPEQDHIFSRSELENAGYNDDEINTIFNIRLVGKTPNQSKSNKPYSEWIKTQNELEREMHHIPKGEWNVDCYKEFIDKRKQLFIDLFHY